jgi:hypothetical protein
MSHTIKLSDDLVNEARRHADVYSRSVPRQIEYWARIGRLSEENPDLPYTFLKDILLSLQEAGDRHVTPYSFG